MSSDTSDSPPSTADHLLQEDELPDIVRDLILWRRKQLNVLLLLGATAAWTVLQVYQYNFITVFSWLTMAILVCFFFWGNIHRLLKKEAPDLSELQISEDTARSAANLFRQRAEETIRLMFHVSVEREWFEFAGVVALLYLLSMVARYFDLLTLCCIGMIGGMSIQAIYIKNEGRIRGMGEKLRNKSERAYGMMEEKLQKMKNKIAEGRQQKEVKQKKME